MLLVGHHPIGEEAAEAARRNPTSTNSHKRCETLPKLMPPTSIIGRGRSMSQQDLDNKLHLIKEYHREAANSEAQQAIWSIRTKPRIQPGIS